MRSHSQPTVITHTRIIDGTGAPEFLGDIVLEHGKISVILPPGGFATSGGEGNIIDGAGLITCPGFIDMQGCSGAHFLKNPQRPSKVSQGVTTEVLGHDGLFYPSKDQRSHDHLQPWIHTSATDVADFDPAIASLGDYLDKFDGSSAINTAFLLPLGTLRFLATGLQDATPTAEQLERMKHLLADGLEQGAIGLTGGSSIFPESFPDTNELEALFSVLAEHGSFYSTRSRHHAELLALAEKYSSAIHLAQVAPGYSDADGSLDLPIHTFDAALKSGVDFSFDTSAYMTEATPLVSLLPAWARTGTLEDVLANLDNDDIAAKIRLELESAKSPADSRLPVDWDTMSVYSVANTQLRVLVNQSIATIARIQRVEPFTVFCNILGADSLATIVMRGVGTEENLVALMQHEAHLGASARSLETTKPHPSEFGAFPRFIAHYGRDLELVDVVQIIRHLTGGPAARLKLAQRGEVRNGYAADLVVFDPDSLMDMSSWTDPTQPAAGIKYVFVNGECVIDEHQPTGALAGRTLRRSGDRTAREH